MAEHRARTAALARRRKRLAESARRQGRAGSLKKKALLESAHDRVNAAQWRERSRADELVHRRVTNPAPDVLPVLVLGAGAVAAYFFLYKPWKIQHDLEALTKAQIDANLKKGMSLTDAANNAVAGACVAGAAVYKVPPEVSGSICKGVGVLAVAGAKAAVKGAVIAGKVIGHDIGKGATAVGSGVKTATKAVGSAAKKTAHAITHGFGLWGVDVDGLGDIAAEPFGSRSRGLYRTGQLRARGPGRTKQRQQGAGAAAGAGFYLRHL
jgi:hypothetical protein